MGGHLGTRYGSGGQVSPKKRFSYLKNDSDNQETNNDATDPKVEADISPTDNMPPTQEDTLRSVPRGEGRMAQPREQLNVRIPTMLKRKAVAKATLEGRTIGDVVEGLLANYIDDADDT